MTMKDLLPWRSHKAVTRSESPAQDPFVSLHREINRLFDGFWGENPAASWGEVESLSPRVDVSESEKEVVVTAELPGLEEKDVQVTLDGNALVLTGEKKAERETKDHNYHRVERSYGSFRRIVPLPSDVDEGKSEAVFRNGVLRVKLQKRAPAEQSRKRITVRTA